MSDKDDKPSTSTSTVPLKKETVRISLRAQTDESGPVAPKGSTAPISAGEPITDPIPGQDASTAPIPGDATTAPIASAQVSAATTGPTAPTTTAAPPAPTAMAPTPLSGPPSAPPSPSATAPPAPGGAPTPPPSAGATPPPAPTATPPPSPGGPTKPVQTVPGAKTIPLSKTDPLGPTAPVKTAPDASASPIGAKTIPLAKAPATLGAGPVGKATTPLQQGGAKPLPQATVKMGKTQPMGQTKTPTSTISQAPDIQSTAVDAEEEWEEVYEESGLTLFSALVLVLSLVVLVVEILTNMGG